MDVRTKMTDQEIEALLDDLIDTHFDKKNRKDVKKWLLDRVALFQAVTELGLLDARPKPKLKNIRKKS